MTTPLIYLLIGAGSAMGGMLRYALSTWIDAKTTTSLPWGIMAVNILGCLAMGLCAASLEKIEWKAFILVGLLGGFTTFSAFSMIAIELCQRGRFDVAGLYIALSLVTCLAGCWAGYAIAHGLRA